MPHTTAACCRAAGDSCRSLSAPGQASRSSRRRRAGSNQRAANCQPAQRSTREGGAKREAGPSGEWGGGRHSVATGLEHHTDHSLLLGCLRELARRQAPLTC